MSIPPLDPNDTIYNQWHPLPYLSRRRQVRRQRRRLRERRLERQERRFLEAARLQAARQTRLRERRRSLEAQQQAIRAIQREIEDLFQQMRYVAANQSEREAIRSIVRLREQELMELDQRIRSSTATQ